MSLFRPAKLMHFFAIMLVCACGKFTPIKVNASEAEGHLECDRFVENCSQILTIGDPEKEKLLPLTCELISSSEKINKGDSVSLAIHPNLAIGDAKINGMNISNFSDPKLEVSPEVTKSYEAVITDLAGRTAKCMVEVTVQQPVVNQDPLPTCSLSALKTTINEGETISVSFSSTHASSAIFDGNPLSGTSGQQNFTPLKSTTIQVSVKGNGGENKCSLLVTVVPKPVAAPACTLTASKTSLLNGEAVTITMKSERATTATLQGQSVNATTQVKSFSPLSTTEFVGQVSGAGGSADCRLKVSVAAAPADPSCTITSTKSTVIKGETITVSMATANATEAFFENSAVSTAGFSQAYVINISKVFEGKVRNSVGKEIICTKVITANDPPAPTCYFTTSKASIEKNETVHISLRGTNIKTATINGEVATVGNVKPYVLTETTTFNGQVSGDGGSATCTTTVAVTGPKAACYINITPSVVPVGGTVHWTMNTSNATSAMIGSNTAPLAGFSASSKIMEKTTFTASATNEYGTNSCSATVNVTQNMVCTANQICLCPAGTKKINFVLPTNGTCKVLQYANGIQCSASGSVVCTGCTMTCQSE